MKKDIHPENYRKVVFKDISADISWLSQSAVVTRDSVEWEDGKEYPLIKLEISNVSHPFFTGKMKFVDTAGRIDKFNKKFGNSRFAKTIGEDEEQDENAEGETAAARRYYGGYCYRNKDRGINRFPVFLNTNAPSATAEGALVFNQNAGSNAAR